jgi:cytochrome b6-f complex iron-sulfur subunit
MSEAVAPTPAEQGTSLPLTRREFLYYLWGISIAVFLAGSGGATVWFSLPRFREGEFGGVFTIPVDQIPAPDTPPQEFPAGRFWLVNVGQKTLDDPRQPRDYPEEAGVKALYKVCVHLGCLYKWVDTNDRFECPCHGSKYLKSGTRVDGPARRNLDVFIIEVIDGTGHVLVRTEPQMNGNEGTAVEPPSGAVSLKIDTGRLVRGAPNSKPGGGM